MVWINSFGSKFIELFGKFEIYGCLFGKFRLGSHCSAYELIRVCRYLSTVHTAPFLCKNPGKNIRFCGFTLLTAMEETISVFVRSHYLLRWKKTSVYVISTLKGVFVNLRFCALLWGAV